MGALLGKLKLKTGEPIRVCMLGLDAAGKTTILKKLKFSKSLRTIPTMGFNVETVNPCRGLTLTIWDIGGQDKIRELWKHYYNSTEGLIYVVDSADSNRFVEAATELNAILNGDEMTTVPLVVLANKQDLPGAVDLKNMELVLQLNKLPPDCPWHVQECCATSGSGIFEAMKILAQFIKDRKKKENSQQKLKKLSSKRIQPIISPV